MGKIVKCVVLYVLQIIELTSAKYSIPDVTVEVLKPKGIRASIPDTPGISLFAFQGNINRRIGNTDVGTLSGEVLAPNNGLWTFEDLNVDLKSNDEVNYYVFVAVDSTGYLKDNLTYKVGEQTTSALANGTCGFTVTSVRGAKVCAGQVIFEDTFDTFRDDVWMVEHKIPLDNPDFPFVSYQNLKPPPSTVYVKDGKLVIRPTLQEKLPGFDSDSIYSGTLDLFSGCTSSADTCTASASGPEILPPVVSGKVSTSGFQFKYGTVEVRAKLPMGDWLYPEILLKPFLKKYGSQNYASGVVKIAIAAGNKNLTSETSIDAGSNKVLSGGPVISLKCHDTLLLSSSHPEDKFWGDDYHTYSVRWEPERLIFSVDGKEWGRVESRLQRLSAKLPASCLAPTNVWSKGGNMAPFDENFFISLGVSAGGITTFKDSVMSSGRPKPWRNAASKAKLTFWQDMAAWYPTWGDGAKLLVDYVKVSAL